ncbi:MAG: InlB B-repeat-containing protein [Bacilli bacterium]|nr:InlB B-repeat-containing protein [Bacilli bacterium]
MKKHGLLITPLMAISFLVSCGGANPTPSAKDYFVSFETYGGTHITPQRVKEGGKVAKPDQPTRKEDNFKGWFLDAEYKTPEYTFNETVNADLTLFAKWDDIGPIIDKNTFVFKSDYCTLDNEESYKSGTPVNLNLSIAEEYKDAYLLPEDIEVLLGSKTGKKDEDYQYNVNADKKTASLSMVVNADIVVHVMYNDSDNIHIVTEEQFDKAMAMEDIPYIQHEYEYYHYYYSSSEPEINLNRVDYISPTVNYVFISNIIQSEGIQQVQSEPKFYSKDSEEHKWQYNYDKKTKTWSKDDSEQEKIPFDVSADVSPMQDPTIKQYLTYDHLKGHYNSETSLYSYDVTASGAEYIVTLSFDKNRLMSLSYETTDPNNGYLCYISYSYFAITPDLPPVKP